MSHLDEGTLTALFDGELGAAERQQAEAHLAGCSECRRLYEQVRTLADEAIQLIETVRPEEPALKQPVRPAGGPRWDRLRPLAWAATLVIAAGLGWSAGALRFRPDASQSDFRPASGRAEEPGPAAPEPAPLKESTAVQSPPNERKLATPREEEAPRRQATEQAAPAVGGMGKTAAAPLAAADRTQNALPRAESSGQDEAPAASVAAQPLQARAAEMNAARDAASPARRFTPADLEQAVSVLGGTVKLIDGLSPTRVAIGPPEGQPGGTPDVVRITYLDPPGRELWLDQQRNPAPGEGRRAPVSVAGLLPGDTLVTALGAGLTRMQWISTDGFRLTLTGYLPGDSLRTLVRRVH